MDADVVFDEWSPTLDELHSKLTPRERRRRLLTVAYKVVALIKRKMTRQVGFADDVPYRKLKIRWRYHGHKNLVANARNMKRAARGAVPQDAVFTRGGVSKMGQTIAVVDKTAVNASTKALIDLGDLYRSWAVIKATASYVDIAPRTPLEKLKAVFNNDRGRWGWGRISGDEAQAYYLEEFDRGIFDK